jgi:hypothetical protein
MIGPFGNWLLGLWELYIRNPNAERYAMFQDDLLAVRNLRAYLERTTAWPGTKAYWNLLTFTATVDVAKSSDSNEALRPTMTEPGEEYVGWYPSNQLGRGAVALVFDREGLTTLLSSRKLVEHPRDATHGHRRIDGIVIDCLKDAGYREFVHWPSLVQHVGELSTIGNPPQAKAVSFPGEEFDALGLLVRERAKI